jgi:CubicO group peptidase (beta-lactamase class C family)
MYLPRLPADAQTRFPLCSMTKLIMALALLRLLYEHGHNENTPVRQILPDFRLFNETAGKAVTWAHVLSHSTGVETSNGYWDDILAKGVTLVSSRYFLT